MAVWAGNQSLHPRPALATAPFLYLKAETCRPTWAPRYVGYHTMRVCLRTPVIPHDVTCKSGPHEITIGYLEPTVTKVGRHDQFRRQSTLPCGVRHRKRSIRQL